MDSGLVNSGNRSTTAILITGANTLSTRTEFWNGTSWSNGQSHWRR